MLSEAGQGRTHGVDEAGPLAQCPQDIGLLLGDQAGALLVPMGFVGERRPARESLMALAIS